MPDTPLVDFFPTRQADTPITIEVVIGYAQPNAETAIQVGQIDKTEPGSFTISPLDTDTNLRGKMMTVNTVIAIHDSLPGGGVTHVAITVSDNVNKKSYTFNSPTSLTEGLASYSAYIHFKPV
jgi:hypothetical protein